MIELADEFRALQSDYQEVLQLAQETNQIKVTPLLELKGGKTGANLFLASVSSLETGKVHHLVLKLDHKSTKSHMDEIERHLMAVSEASAEFARDHIPVLVYNRNELGNAIAIFYNIAGQSLHLYKPLALYPQQSKIEQIFRNTNEILLEKWNSHPAYRQAVHPQKVLTDWLGYRLKPGGNIENFLADTGDIDPNTSGLLILDNVFPNPWPYAINDGHWGAVRNIDLLVGFQHGDLNIGNILAKFEDQGESLEGLYLIDFALFKPNMPLFYDILYLQMSYLVREMTRVTFQGWIDLVTRFSEKDIIDPTNVPVELAGACSVINSGRLVFGDWVRRYHTSLSDDLWGQYWLAAVAAGLNYCNKTIISDNERLAGFIFAAVHLKRYHRMFRVALPEEITTLRIMGRQEESHPKDGSKADHLKRRKIILPGRSSPLIGRENEIKELKELLQRESLRLITLTGPGGTGKTSLAVHLASELGSYFNDGIYFIDLSPVREPDSLFSTIARIIGLRESSGQPLIEDIASQLNHKKILLLLDNFEQLTSAIQRVADLLEMCPLLKLIVTSREALRIRGEQVFPVAPLEQPDSVKLFIERASAVRPGIKISEEDLQVIAKICSRLDGLPLAIELAVARINIFSPMDLLKRLDARMKLLRGGARDLPVRQQTLESTIGWSYELLDNEEKNLFALFSVFHHCSMEELEAVADGARETEEVQANIVDIVSSLIDKNLIRSSADDHGIKRFQMLETIREYASERLAEDADFQSSVRRSHARFFADFSQQQWKRLTGSEREEALGDFGKNVENVRISWQFWVDEKDLVQLQKLTDSLWMLYDARGWFSENVALTTDLLKVIGSTPSSPEITRQEILLQTSLGRVLMAIKGCTPEVETIFNNALELCNKYGEIPRSFPILRALSSFYAYLGNMPKCKLYGEQIIELAEQLDDPYMKVDGHLIFGFSIAFSGDLQKGMEQLEMGMAIFTPKLRKSKSYSFGTNPGLICYTTSAICSWMLGNTDKSFYFTKQALALSEHLDHPSSKIYALFHSGLLHHYRKEHEIALQYAVMALQIAEDHEFQIWKAVVACLHGAALAAVGQVEDGMEEFNRALEKYAELKTPPIFWPMLLMIKAGTLIQADQQQEALDVINETFGILGEDEGNPLLSELYRLKGDVLLIVAPDEIKEAQTLFTQAREIAQRHGTAAYELRAAMSLSRIWISENKKKESREILNEAIEKFTGDSETLDLKEAKALLEQMK